MTSYAPNRQQCVSQCVCTGTNEGRFPDLRPLEKMRWRDAWRALVGPAERLHKYRNLRTALFYGAMRRLDECGQSAKRKTAAISNRVHTGQKQ